MSARTLAEEVGLTAEEADRIAQVGLDLIDSGQFEEAAAVFEGLLVLNPHDPFAHSALGVTLQERGDDRSAEAAFTQALEGTPKMPMALLSRGILLLKRGEPSGLDDLRAVSTLNDDVGARARDLLSALEPAPRKKVG